MAGRNEPHEEWMVQDAPGVYITISSLPGGGNHLTRIRFSRKRFSLREAEEWWAENRAQVYQRHDIRSTFNSVGKDFLLQEPMFRCRL